MIYCAHKLFNILEKKGASLKKLMALCLGLLWSLQIFAEGSAPDEAPLSPEADRLVELHRSLKFQSGKAELTSENNVFAQLNLGEKFAFLAPEDSKKLLEDLWGNPAGTSGGVLGMIVPTNANLFDDDSWAITLRYEKDGYVSDDDASEIDYKDLLEKMKKDTAEASVEREKLGQPKVELVGWADAPTYEKSTHTLYWSKELKFGDLEVNTLNYNIRVLGRRGVLVMNVIGGMPVLPQINERKSEILSLASFVPEERYEAFDEKTDKKSSYGLAALVAGTFIAQKVGIFKGLLIFLLAAKKFVIVGVIALGVFLRKLFSSKANVTVEPIKPKNE